MSPRKRPASDVKRLIKFTAVSSEDQADDDLASLETQSAVLDDLALKRGGIVVDHIEVAVSRNFFNWYDFRDAALSEGYDGALRMEQHWKARDFDEVLVWDGTRFGRKESIFAEFVLRTIESGATIYMHIGGELNESNHGPAMMLGAFATGQETRLRKARVKMGMDKRFAKALPPGRPGIAHLPVRDEYGRTTDDYILNPAFTSLWRDLATLILKGVSWDDMERVLYERFKHINPKTGRQWARLTMHGYVLTRPMFWGHVARYHTYSENSKTNYATNSLHWLYDESVPLPEHVEIHRNVFPAVWTGETAEAIKAELRRRRDLYGRASPEKTHMFSGLCRCAVCGHPMTTQILNGSKTDRTRKLRYVGCRTYVRGGDCDNRLYFSYKDLQAFLDKLLREIIRLGQFTPSTPATVAIPREELATEITRLEGQIDTLTGELSLLSDAARPRVRKQIDALAARLEIAQGDMQKIDLVATQQHLQSRDEREAIQQIQAIGVDAFWALEERVIHQLLKKLFGKRALLVKDKKIVRIFEG